MSIYLDNNATTRVATETLEAMLCCYGEDYGNPSSMHSLGQRAKEKLIAARSSLARLIGASPQEIVFTSCGTESSHMAILGACALSPEKKHLVTSQVEHPAELALFDHLEAQGYRVTRLEVDSDGQLDLDALERAVTEDTALVSLMWANNETGVLFPVGEAARIAKSAGSLFHTDAVQAAGKTKIDLAAVPADFLSLSGHKMHAAKGVGALFVRKGIKLPALFFGHQERGRRGGTENLPAIVGLGVASELAMEGLEHNEARIGMLRSKLEEGILSVIPFARVNGSGVPRVANTTNINFGDLDSEAILDRLDRAGIHASSGAACTAGGNEPSHVLLAMGLGKSAQASLRFSLSRYTTDEEIEHVLDVLPGIVETVAN